MKISIITVCFNAENTIERCLLSVLDQSYSDIEYIIIDGFSADSTVSIIEKYKSHISKLVSEPDKGIYDAMNKGIALATGEMVGILNADDVFAHENVLIHIAEKFKEDQNDSLYADLQYVNSTKVIRHWNSGSYKINNWYWGWMPPHPTFYVKRELYAKFGNFNTELKLAADYEIMLRFLLKHKISASYLPEVTVKMAVGGVSNKSIKNRLLANQEDKKAWTINNLSMPFYLPLLKPLRKVMQFLKK